MFANGVARHVLIIVISAIPAPALLVPGPMQDRFLNGSIRHNFIECLPAPIVPSRLECEQVFLTVKAQEEYLKPFVLHHPFWYGSHGSLPGANRCFVRFYPLPAHRLIVAPLKEMLDVAIAAYQKRLPARSSDSLGRRMQPIFQD